MLLKKDLFAEYEEKNNVPAFFKNLYPAITITEYKKLINDPTFKNKTFYLCEDCFMETTRFMKSFGGSGSKFQTKFGILAEVMKKDPFLKSVYVKIFIIFYDF